MNPSPPLPDSSHSVRPLRWWQWLAFVCPSLVAVGTTGVLNALGRAKYAALAHPTASDSYWVQHMGLYNGLAGINAGAVCCLGAGILLGLTMPAKNRVLACVGWTLLGTLTNAALSFAGCSLLPEGE